MELAGKNIFTKNDKNRLTNIVECGILCTDTKKERNNEKERNQNTNDFI